MKESTHYILAALIGCIAIFIGMIGGLMAIKNKPAPTEAKISEAYDRDFDSLANAINTVIVEPKKITQPKSSIPFPLYQQVQEEPEQIDTTHVEQDTVQIIVQDTIHDDTLPVKPKVLSPVDRLHIGMSTKEVLNIMGWPSSRKKAVKGYHVRQKFIYDFSDIRLYFSKDTLSLISLPYTGDM